MTRASEKALIDFATKYSGWHSYWTKCKLTRDTVKSLSDQGIIIVNEYNQFTLSGTNLDNNTAKKFPFRVLNHDKN